MIAVDVEDSATTARSFLTDTTSHAADAVSRAGLSPVLAGAGAVAVACAMVITAAAAPLVATARAIPAYINRLGDLSAPLSLPCWYTSAPPARLAHPPLALAAAPSSGCSDLAQVDDFATLVEDIWGLAILLY